MKTNAQTTPQTSSEIARIFASVAPATPDGQNETIEHEPICAPSEAQAMHELFERWAYWSNTRRYFAPAPQHGSLLGRLSSKSRVLRHPEGMDANCSAEMAALHLAITAQPKESLDYKVFWLYYVKRVPHVKIVALELEVSRGHFYRLLTSFGKRVQAAAAQILSANAAEIKKELDPMVD